MKSFTKSIRFSIVSLSIWLSLAVLNAVAQEPPQNPDDISDAVGVFLQKSTAYTVAYGSITEYDEFIGLPLDVFVPGTMIRLLEPGFTDPHLPGAISDVWTIQPYRIHLISDSPGTIGHPPRPNAIGVPDETFIPISMRFTSDADFAGQAYSDSLDIFINGALFKSIPLFETPGQAERAPFYIPDQHFDLYEGDQTAYVSDYVDIDPIYGEIISDYELTGLGADVPPGFKVFDFQELESAAVYVDYDVVAFSDPVPEPSALALLTLGGLALVSLQRCRRARQES